MRPPSIATNFRVTAAVIAGIALKPGAAQPTDAPAAAGVERKTVLAHYMPWYETPTGRGGGEWGRHWTGHSGHHDPSKTDATGLPDIWSHFHPMIDP